MQLLAAMAPPGGGRNAFSARIMAVFSTVNMAQVRVVQTGWGAWEGCAPLPHCVCSTGSQHCAFV